MTNFIKCGVIKSLKGKEAKSMNDIMTGINLVTALINLAVAVMMYKVNKK